MPAGLFERIIGKFKNGAPVHLVPEPYRTIFSIQDALSEIVNKRTGEDPLRPLYGVPYIPDTAGKIPPNAREINSLLKRTITVYEPRIRKVFFGGWQVHEKKAYPLCLIVCFMHNGAKAGFVLHFKGMGNNEVKLWRRRG